MGAIEHLTISIPSDVADSVRDRVAAGEFADLNEAVLEAVLEFEAERADERPEPSEEWLRQKIRSALAEYEADPSCAMSVDEARRRLAAARLKRVVAVS